VDKKQVQIVEPEDSILWLANRFFEATKMVDVTVDRNLFTKQINYDSVVASNTRLFVLVLNRKHC
jgi:hypothetical protein